MWFDNRRTHKQWLVGLLQQRDASISWKTLSASDLKKVALLIGGWNLETMKGLTGEKRWISTTEWARENERE